MNKVHEYLFVVKKKKIKKLRIFVVLRKGHNYLKMMQPFGKITTCHKSQKILIKKSQLFIQVTTFHERKKN